MSTYTTIVIKVKYGEDLKRFRSRIVDIINEGGMRKKVVSLFKFAPSADIKITYIDEDGDSVTLDDDDDDLIEVARQSLNPLRLTVTLKSVGPSLQYLEI